MPGRAVVLRIEPPCGVSTRRASIADAFATSVLRAVLAAIRWEGAGLLFL